MVSSILFINTVHYIYGNGTTLNRKIEFVQIENSQDLRARISIIGGKQIADIPADQIKVEMQSATDLLNRYVSLRQNPQNVPKPKLKRILSSFTSQEQVNIALSINPDPQTEGGRWIELKNNPIGTNGNETILKLKIIDPR